MMSFIFIIYSILSLSTPSVIPEKIDVSGHWEGTITRDEGAGKRTTFVMELDVIQKGKDITGISYVHADGEQRTFSASMSIVGKVSKTYVAYDETKILNFDPIPNAEWCIKKVELLYKLDNKSVPTLEGVWQGTTNTDKLKSTCMPGRVYLHKKPPRV